MPPPASVHLMFIVTPTSPLLMLPSALFIVPFRLHAEGLTLLQLERACKAPDRMAAVHFLEAPVREHYLLPVFVRRLS